MKIISFCLVIASFIFACNNDGTTKTTSVDSGKSSPNFTNVQNVNGNRPDTTNGITLDNRASGDTSKMTDTSHH
ncbi:MAG: hypothetical protein M3Y85_04975 [Bacteroidota bacterium]|nr:hypothetical protein [Bacteroidota bacterium]